MAWNIRNAQADDMTLTLRNNNVVNLPGNGNVIINSEIESITYHRLNYAFGAHAIWPFHDNVDLVADYPGQQSIYVKQANGHGGTAMYNY